MGEYQYVVFRAIDRPVTDKNLAYMEQQSSRANITKWSFEYEYYYGDFRGDELEILRRGYDIHLHFANFGIRKIMIRLPNGLSNKEITRRYFEEKTLILHPEKTAKGVIIEVNPYYEDSDLDFFAGVEETIEQLIHLRAEIIEGDLRPLYLAHLAMAS